MQNNSRAGIAGGAILIGLGALFLLAQFVRFDVWHFAWPFAVIGIGGLFFVGMLAGGRSAAGLAVPGSIISAVGLILLYQNTFGYWESWTYAWTLIVIAVGVGIFIMGVWNGQESTRRSGLSVAGVGAILLLVFGSFFELGFGLLGWPRVRHIFGPLLLIALGLYLLARSLFSRRPSPPISSASQVPAVAPESEQHMTGGAR